MKQFLSTLVLTTVLITNLQAQVALPEQKGGTELRANVFGLGFAVGAASGIGLSFRHHLPSVWSYQITGGIIKVNDKVSAAIGGEVQYDLVRTGRTRYFAGGGVGYYYSGNSSGNDLDAPGRLGLGIGGEFLVAPSMHATAELLFTYFTDGTILPLPQLGVHYYFY